MLFKARSLEEVQKEDPLKVKMTILSNLLQEKAEFDVRHEDILASRAMLLEKIENLKNEIKAEVKQAEHSCVVENLAAKYKPRHKTIIDAKLLNELLPDLIKITPDIYVTVVDADEYKRMIKKGVIGPEVVEQVETKQVYSVAVEFDGPLARLL